PYGHGSETQPNLVTEPRPKGAVFALTANPPAPSRLAYYPYSLGEKQMTARLFAIAALFTATLSAQLTHEAALKNLKFREIGPAIMGGRVDDFAVVESDPRIIYVGSAAGGVFKTVNAGMNWEPIFDDQPNSTIGDVAIA